MTWFADNGLDIVGWGGSALLVYSLLQASVLRLRVLNAIACVILIVFNAMLEVWPMVGMNIVLVTINAWFIVKMIRHRHDETAYEVLEVAAADGYLRHVLRVHGADISKFNPGFVHDPSDPQDAFPIQKGDETVGVVLLRREGTTAHVVLDYVTPRFRDFAPGEFVWRQSGMLAEQGIRRIITPPGMLGAYYGRLGFTRSDTSWILELER